MKLNVKIRVFTLITAFVLLSSILSLSHAATLLLGDANSDGEINAKDVAIIRRYIVGGWDIDYTIETFDVYADEEINGKDIVLLRRKIVENGEQPGDADDSENSDSNISGIIIKPDGSIELPRLPLK